MGVYIKGMEMPKGCATCPYCDRAWNKPKCKAKSVQGRFMEQKLNLDRTRQKWCPLVPVPPHGRLIDADALAEHKFVSIPHVSIDGKDAGTAYRLGWNTAIEAVMENAETIIGGE